MPSSDGSWRTPLSARDSDWSDARSVEDLRSQADQLIKDGIITPLISGDSSLRTSGLKRAIDLALYATPTNVVTSALRTLAAGRAPTALGILQGIGSTGGRAGYVAVRGGEPALAPKYGTDPVEGLVGVPGLEPAVRAAQDLLGAAYYPGKSYLCRSTSSWTL